MDSAADIAASHQMRGAMGLPGGQLIANPIPQDVQIPAQTLAPIIAQALDEAATKGIAAKAVTPFLLGRIFELTDGASLTANIALVRNNAALAAKIAASF
jgi:pseudouridine-5'-phosphate glycosidase